MDVASAYICAYALAYFATGIHVKEPFLKRPGNPWPEFDRLVMFLVGIGLVVAVASRWWFVILPLAFFEAWTVMLQWWHVILWRIPDLRLVGEWPTDEVSPTHQISMTMTNLACAVALFSLL